MFDWLWQIYSRGTKTALPQAQNGSDSSGVTVTMDELIQLSLKARSMGFESRRQVAFAPSGPQSSRLRGRGVDYQESRNYQPGDDIRHMDWRVTARTGRPHTKLFQEERERAVIVTVDFNASMFFGTQNAFKSVVAARAAAFIGWAAIYQGDRIGGFLFGHKGHQDLPASGGRRGALQLIRALVAETSFDKMPASDSRLQGFGETLLRLRRIVRPGSLVVILSDFYGIDKDTELNLSRLRQHNDVVACLIADTVELTAPPPGRYAITDSLQTSILDIYSPQVRERYEVYCASRQQRVKNLLGKYSIPLLTLMTDQNTVSQLQQGFRALSMGPKRATMP
jgi:uncharacterized protein (DUF58 family)